MNWAGNTLNCQSTTEYYIFDGDNLVSWKSKKQHVVDCSIAEEEYNVMTSTTCELIWIKSLLADLGFMSVTPMILFCHNQVLS